MHPRMLLLLVAVLALGAVACETDNPPQPIVEGPSIDADRATSGVTVRPPAAVTPREVTPTNLAPTPPRLRAPRLPVVDSAPATPRQPAVAPPPAVSPTAAAQHQASAPVEYHGQPGGGVGGVVNRVASPLP